MFYVNAILFLYFNCFCTEWDVLANTIWLIEELLKCNDIRKHTLKIVLYCIVWTMTFIDAVMQPVPVYLDSLWSHVPDNKFLCLRLIWNTSLLHNHPDSTSQQRNELR